MKIKISVVLLVCATAVIGAVFGFMGQMWYGSEIIPTAVTYPEALGIFLGMVMGAGTGWVFAAGITAIGRASKKKWPVVVRGSLLGLVTGLVCSTVFHVILMVLHRTTGEGVPMLAGAICSGPAGLLIGLVFSSILAYKGPNETAALV